MTDFSRSLCIIEGDPVSIGVLRRLPLPATDEYDNGSDEREREREGRISMLARLLTQSEPSEVLIRLARSRTIIDATADFYLD